MEKQTDWKPSTIAHMEAVGCMRRFALMNFQITTKADIKLSYTPCYVSF